MTVAESWKRIESLRSATVSDFMPLPRGATADEIRQVEAVLGVALPDDVRESYAIHDGSGEIGIVPCELYGLISVSLHSLGEMLREWHMWQEWRHHGNHHETASPAGPIKTDRYNPHWVSVAWDGGGVNLCIDLDPAPGGVHGQMIYLDHLEPQCVAADGWSEFLERYAADLEAGRLRFEAGELVAAE